MRHVLSTLVTLALAVAVFTVGSVGYAQNSTEPSDELFQDEARHVEAILEAAFPPVVVDERYEGEEFDIDGSHAARPARWGAREIGAGPYAVDIAGIDPPFGLERLDDPAMRAFLDFYATDGLTRAVGWVAASGRYRAMLTAALREANMPEELLWVVAIESAFDPRVESHAGAVGLWQLMPRTARALGLRVDGDVDERRDPELATAAAIEHLRDQYERFGSWPLALAAYNAGHGHARGELRRYGVTDFWEAEDYGAMYGDARRYAMRAITLAVFDRYPERFGAEGIVLAEPIEWDTVMIEGRVRMSLLAEAAGCSLDELNALNPALLGNSTPGEGEWPLRIPAGTYDDFVDEYDDVQRAHGSSHHEVTLRLGETVESLAERYGISGRLVRAINDLERRASVPAGTVLIIPSRYSPSAAAASDEPIVIVTTATEFRLSDRQRIFYQTVAGDSVTSIAEFLDVDRYQLAAWNDLSVSANLPTELWMQIFVSELPDPDAVVFAAEGDVQALALGSAEYIAWEEARESASQQRRRTYTVRRGDTLIGIAQRYDVRVRDLMRWNRLEDAGRIYEGQELRLTR